MAPSFKPRESEESPASAEGERVPKGVLVLAFVAGWLIAYLGGRSFLVDLEEWRRLRSLDSFIAAPATFLKVGIRRDTVTQGNEFYPDLLFEYFVDGRSIWGWRLSYEEIAKPESYWKSRLAPYAQGAGTTIYYDPRNPKESVVERKTDGWLRPLLKMLLSLLFALFGALLIVLPLSSGAFRTESRRGRR